MNIDYSYYKNVSVKTQQSLYSNLLTTSKFMMEVHYEFIL